MASIFNTTQKKEAFGDFDTEYVTYKEVERVADGFDAKNPEEFLIETTVVEDTRVPIEEDINSHSSKVGLKNLLKGIVSQRQMSELIEETKNSGQYIDLTKLPDSHLAIEELAGSIDAIWDSIPAELRGSLTKEEFVKSISSKKIEEYVASELAKKKALEEKVEDK